MLVKKENVDKSIMVLLSNATHVFYNPPTQAKGTALKTILDLSDEKCNSVKVTQFTYIYKLEG